MDSPSQAATVGYSPGPHSRRRLAFRRWADSRGSTSSEPTTSATAAASSTMSPSAKAAASTPTFSAMKRGTTPPPQCDATSKAMWSHNDVMAFYDGLKQYGKDFDGLMTMLVRRKVVKDSQQTKNFYFNLIKSLHKAINFDDDMSELSRDAKEMFLMINALEWRKSTNNAKIVPERLRELIMEGSTTARIKRKLVPIRTPICPALQRLVPAPRRISKFPNEVIIRLEPRTHEDSTFVRDLGHNPLISVRLSSNERISRLFELLRKKWASQESTQLTNNLGLTLFPAAGTQIGAVTLYSSSTTSNNTLSLARLQRELNRASAAKNDKHQQNQPGTSYSVVVDHPFVLKEQFFTDGLTEDNVGSATAAELYCMCGVTMELSMVYELRGRQKPSMNPWQVLVSVLSRDYSEALPTTNVANRKENISDQSNEDIVSITNSPVVPTAPAPKSTVVHHRSTLDQWKPVQQSPARSNEMAPRREPQSTPTVVRESEIVLAETEAFAMQFSSLSKRKRKATVLTTANLSAVNRRGSSLCSATTSGDVDAARTSNPRESEKRNEPKYAKMRPVTFDSSMRPNEDTMDRLFGGELSKSPEYSRNRHDVFAMISDLSMHSRDVSQSASNLGSLPADVYETMHKMNSQNSIDFAQSFEVLMNATGSPLKKKRL